MNNEEKRLMNNLYEDIEKLPVIDTHEHLPPREHLRDQDTDVLEEYLSHYLSSDLVSAGLKQEDLQTARDHSRPLLERWKLIEPYWEASHYTGYARALDISVHAIYGIEGISRHTIEELQEQFQAKKKPEHFRHVLQELCNIELAVLDAFVGERFDCDTSLFRRVWQPEKFVIPSASDTNKISWLKETYGLNIRSLDDWMEAFRIELDDQLHHGIIGLKCILAYMRTLRFESVPYAVARTAFAAALQQWENSGAQRQANPAFPIEVQDFMMHDILKTANEKGLLFQVHTGMLEGNSKLFTHGDPSLLLNLFLAYPDVRFDLFHIGYPYQHLVSAICKNFPNVFIDMCWAHIISPAASIHALSDFLDAVPYNKISAFGGDYLFIDGVYGHLHLARENVSRVLAQKISDGVFSYDAAITIARHLFYENPRRIFRLS